jgi:hypothetical protein
VEQSYGKMDQWHSNELKKLQAQRSHLAMHARMHILEKNSDEDTSQGQANRPSMMVD